MLSLEKAPGPGWFVQPASWASWRGEELSGSLALADQTIKLRYFPRVLLDDTRGVDFDVKAPELWVPSFGWYQGLWHDGGLWYVTPEQRQLFIAPGAPWQLNWQALPELGLGVESGVSKQMLCQSLVWAWRLHPQTQGWQAGAAYVIELENYELWSRVALILLRRAFPKFAFVVSCAPSRPQEKRFLEHLGMKVGQRTERQAGVWLKDFTVGLTGQKLLEVAEELNRLSPVDPC